jgi:hypothetical protein
MYIKNMKYEIIKGFKMNVFDSYGHYIGIFK